MAPALVFVTRRAVQERMVDGVEISLQLETVRERFAKPIPTSMTAILTMFLFMP